MSALSGVSAPLLLLPLTFLSFSAGIGKLICGKVDIALWDLKARRLGVPIYQLLGGKVRDKLKVYAWIGGDRPDGVELQA